jgi:hypothetical protein
VKSAYNLAVHQRENELGRDASVSCVGSGPGECF